jgi:hypothetical protein
MKSVQVIIDIPENLYLSLSSAGLTREKIVIESKKLLASKCFREKTLSLGRAAELSGLTNHSQRKKTIQPNSRNPTGRRSEHMLQDLTCSE